MSDDKKATDQTVRDNAAEIARINAINGQIDILSTEKRNIEASIAQYKTFINNIVILKENISNTIIKNDNTYSTAMESILEDRINCKFQNIQDYSISLKQHISNLFSVYEFASSIYNSKNQRCSEIDLEIRNLYAQL